MPVIASTSNSGRVCSRRFTHGYWNTNSKSRVFKSDAKFPFRHDGITFDEGFRADWIVENLVLLELKSVEHSPPAHKKQVLTYLKVTGLKLGLLLKFGEPLMKDGISRIANGLKEASASPND